ncbi:hypothetical protein MPTK1_6g13270 [Marchantia polymorpha subsp. ruderalis]|uniref:Uncharacterized protein n=2 Tax=Marchantia polymorpha TaxID=3197 RepID=A0AAF6BRL5_MARPO|nr:hypothetical protein MARPO_0059s0022 [Marchantia polymorpha]BBN14649.1 hypothetical protein Mp_6g13270 [Marchantia polymorpha subsp. ruderalis]|eukprot:PTQ37070.1 hypothetical protein MARPO_0059s0022 [Marchantia polymorpha]
MLHLSGQDMAGSEAWLGTWVLDVPRLQMTRNMIIVQLHDLEVAYIASPSDITTEVCFGAQKFPSCCWP